METIRRQVIRDYTSFQRRYTVCEYVENRSFKSQFKDNFLEMFIKQYIRVYQDLVNSSKLRLNKFENTKIY
jgi:hypothetical protein